jgi:hypothetical protein
MIKRCAGHQRRRRLNRRGAQRLRRMADVKRKRGTLIDAGGRYYDRRADNQEADRKQQGEAGRFPIA